jgi:DNA-binding MarR family transcriptional regulator
MTTAGQPFGTALIGQTEKALNAILDRQLAGTGITEPQWVTLTLTAVGGGAVDRAELIRRVAGATQVSRAAVADRIAELTAAGFLRDSDSGDDRVEVTDEGHARWTRVRTAIGPITQGLWGDLPAEDLAAATRVLRVVLDRAHAVLAA